ncbi:SEC14-like protein 2, partial [Stegodyphus mimosarum]
MLEDPTLFYRFLKARDFNLKDAESMLRKNITWRKTYQVDTILTDFVPPKVFEVSGFYSRIGFDKEGSPVIYSPIGTLDVKGILASAKLSDIIRYNALLVEQDIVTLRAQSEKLGKLLTQITYIYDFDKISFVTATSKKVLDMYLMGATMFQDNYPERIKAVFIINTSIYFQMFFSVIKPVLASVLLEKIQVFGREGWQEILLQHIDEDVLPAFLGGKRTDPDGNPNCNTFISHGGAIPESYYLTKSTKSLSKSPGVKKFIVTRFSSVDIKFEVKEIGSFIQWEFETKCRDIGFGLYLKTSKENKLIELIPKQRIDTSFESETGMYKCEKAGTYILTFDNTYSWFHSKEIYLRATIVRPEDQVIPVSETDIISNTSA